MMKDDGGQAFPRPGAADGGAWSDRPQDGMTLRDWFAGQALTGLLAAHSADGQVLPSSERAARWAYGYADAMLAAREAEPAPESVPTHPE